jgi:galactokinase
MDLAQFLDLLRRDVVFEPGAELTVSRAPGRLDVMGGIADYSGSLVLQRPIADATFAAVQRLPHPTIHIVSRGRPPFSTPARPLVEMPPAYDAVRQQLSDAQEQWVTYVLGMLLVLIRERGLQFDGGLRIAIASVVPEGKGVSSSAALETAVMRALADAFSLPLEPRDLALLCQLGENHVAGAPCGVMDQMTCVFGQPDALLCLLCQPAELQAAVPIPDDLTFWGIDSGERHTVGGSDYGAVRTGTFMGFRMLQDRDDVPRDYLANVSPAVFDGELASLLPEEMPGAAFLERYGSSGDTVTGVDPRRSYRVRTPASHPVHEHQRVRTFRQLLLAPETEERRRLLGELMYQSHVSYGACGLGSPGTDRLVSLVRAEGAQNGLYGARITGGGCGGTVVVLGRADAWPAVSRVAAAYRAATGHDPQIFSGSSPGVASFGAKRVYL